MTTPPFLYTYKKEGNLPFTMTHLIIADKLTESLSFKIDNLPQFFLGNIAPDTVHNRNGYISDYKKASHFYPGEGVWGMITDNGEWIESVVSTYKRHKNSENRDFVLGCCAHILADIYHNIHIWTPYRLANSYQPGMGYLNKIYPEHNRLDIELALTHEKREYYFSTIKDSQSVDFNGVIYADETDMQKDNILNKWYKDKERQNISANEIVTYGVLMDMIDKAVEFINGIISPPTH
jgi:hypothetical protein